MLLIIIIVSVLIAATITIRSLRKPLVGDLHLIDGGVKKGKTAHAVMLVIKLHKKAMRKWKKHGKNGTAPVLYSNVPIINYPYTPITKELLEMKVAPVPGSIFYINEVSLLSGSKDIKNEYINDTFLKFYKLCSHITMGGKVILDTQNVFDMHYTIKRSLSTYWHIKNAITIPKIGILQLIECREVVDPEIRTEQQLQMEDNAENIIKKLTPRSKFIAFVPATVWKKYDRYAYHSLVEGKEEYSDNIITKEGKVDKILRYRQEK